MLWIWSSRRWFQGIGIWLHVQWEPWRMVASKLHQRLCLQEAWYRWEIEYCRALEYLHHQCVIPLVHREPSNVLLNDEMTGHQSDFGLARFLPEPTHKSLTAQTSSTGMKGSFGYVAPGNIPPIIYDINQKFQLPIEHTLMFYSSFHYNIFLLNMLQGMQYQHMGTFIVSVYLSRRCSQGRDPLTTCLKMV